MTSANTSSDAATPPAALTWYSKVFSRRLDLIGDYVGNNFFLIDGNSLLLHCFSDEHIDFSQGFQLLHATWAVERFLKDLIRRRCHFHIAFLDQYRELCVPSFVSDEAQRERFLLASAAIIRHLRANLPQTHPETSVKVFESVFADEFANYLRDVEFFFVLAHDGAFPEALRKRYLLRNNLDASQDEVDDEANQREQETKTAFRQIIHWFMSGGMSVALINGISFQDTKVMSNVLEHRNVESGVPLTIDFQNDSIDEPRPNYLKRSFWEKMNGNGDAKLSERQYISLLVLSALLHGEVISSEFADAFLRHSALISQLHLSERFVEAEGLDEEASDMLQEFCEEASLVLSSEEWAINMRDWECICDVADLVDGRLLAACLKNKGVGRNESYEALSKAMAATGSDVAGRDETSQKPNGTDSQTTPSQTSAASYAVLPFSNNVIDPHLEPIKISIDRSGEIPPATTSQIFREATHWHNSKRPMDPKIREDQIASSAKQMKKVLRRNQFFMAEMTTYAASLTNSVGRTLEPEIITTGAKPEKKETENTKGKPAPKANQNPKGGKKGAPSRKETMLAQIAKDKSRKDEASADTIVAGWRVTCDNLEKEPTAMARFQKAKQYLAALTEFKKNVLEAEIRLYLLHNRLTMWVQLCKNDKKEENQHIAAGVYESLLSLSQLRRPVTKTITLCLEKTIKELGLPKVPLPTPTENDRKLAFKFVLSNTSGVSLALPTDSITFQLSYCGPYLDRSMDSAPDSRVPFEPDAWQRKVLDEIDARRSLLVVAPTSAGKTFISFYAMQQVLASNDDDVLVYVAPTKALVNQIAAEVQGRFSKTYKYGGNSVWGIHTRDYRINNPTGCQILVTVPHILQIMLLAPSNAGSWAKRVKWIIFDEVHCIGQAEDGQVWEQLLLMAPCPIIALSATIGNPEEFSDWLTSTQEAVGNTLTMVRHPHRYSDLRKFQYTPMGATEFQGLPESRAFARLGLDDEAFSFLHPVTSLINRSRGIPDDFSLEAADCLTLWQTLSKYQSANYPVDKSLDPKVALPPIIKKLDIIKWEKSLKQVLKSWMSDPDSPFESVVKELGKSVQKSDFSLDNSKALEQKKDVNDGEDEDEKEPEDTFDAESILPMLVRLHEQDALPGIIFNYDRGLCEKICLTLLDQLETAETRWKETSPKWKSDLKKWEEYKAIMAKANKRNPPKLSKKKGNDEDGLTKEDIARDGANNEANPWASFDPERPVDRFHFADNKKLTREELDVYERELIRRDVSEWLLRALRRGIGVHHAGMNRKYRQVCEMLFRRGYLRVVVATGTLALGINMPCKTVVFSGDSVFLTALNYRQAAGRAGRRGFDMLGNVVFHGISGSKIHRLVSSRLPDINGHFPITTTLVLRLFTLLNESNQAPVAIRAVNALLSQPRLYLGGEESKLTVLHFLRFSIEYLRKQYLLGPRGEPINLAGVVSHLYYTESSSFAFHALVKEGFFHRLCNNFDTQREAVLQEMILVMAHLFGRQPCKYADREYIENVVKRSPSIVFLPPMPEDASEILKKHNQSTLGIYKGYVKTFAEQNIHEPEDALPLTNMEIKGDSNMKSSSDLGRRAPPIVRSPFVALSGYTDDDIDSIHDLCSTVRSGIFLEEAIVPYVGVHNEKSDMPLNAYLYDFYNHGDVKALAVANRIRRGDVWFVLNDFSMVLATIVTSLSNFMNLSSDSELDVRGEGEGVEEAQEDKLLPDDSGYETGSTISAASRGPAARNVLPVQVKKKKKVAESWDDDADEEDLQAERAAKAERVEAELRALEEKPAWEEGQGLLNVLKAFKALKEEFDTKFRAMWA
ncbi:P-loop containing nucleoside triphosphate hydrolase protein [Periconia macrospinosa]|uniref:P-loop containing nucleoside triphosphate hydrolase protein n=1 Tax=Periconia macrospinosa TaxID=97972 RepID=A0A2V1DM31_9PLEO|nr:P-loop containing nucleoside triphosphate hydrolase protein [Periconia macrospinosa]